MKKKILGIVMVLALFIIAPVSAKEIILDFIVKLLKYRSIHYCFVSLCSAKNSSGKSRQGVLYE